MKILRVMAVLLLALLFKPVFAQDGAVRLSYGPDKWLQVHFLLQARGDFSEHYDQGESPREESSVDKSFYLRRSRIILQGQVEKNITFFMETDDLAAGKNNNDEYENSDNASNKVFTQDAYINYRIADELQIAVGMILLPFMHHNRQSAVSLLGIDYNSTIVDASLSGNTNVWRDTGLEVRGLFLNGLFDYRIGVFQGRNRDETDNTNTRDYPRYTGRIQLNLVDAETGFFYSGNYLGKKNIVSFGGGIDFQQQVFARNGGVPDDYMAWTVDFILDYNLGKGNALAFQAAYLNVKNSPETFSLISGSEYRHSYSYFVQTGFLFSKIIQPVIKYYNLVRKDVGGGSDVSTSHIIGGINYFIKGHNANIKADYWYPMGDNTETGEKKGSLQFQIFI